MTESFKEWSEKWHCRDFRLEEQVGTGGMGAVHRAIHLPTGGTYAVKVVSPRTRADWDHLKREIELSLKIRSPHVIRTYGSETKGKEVWIVMQYVVGDSLKSVLRNHLFHHRQFPFFDAGDYLALFRSIASGLHAIHRSGVVHCDVKPENVMLGESGYWVHDLGIAREVHAKPSEVSGTPTYMAPEQIRKEPLDARTDLYSLGVTMYEVATGVPPFLPPSLQKIADGLCQPGLLPEQRWELLGKYLQARIADLQTSRMGIDLQQAHAECLFDQHLKVSPRLPAVFPYAPEVGKVLLKCLAKDRRFRWSNALELCEQLDRLGAAPADA